MHDIILSNQLVKPVCDLLFVFIIQTQCSYLQYQSFFLYELILEEGLGSSSGFWAAALQKKCKVQAEPTFLRERTNGTIKGKEEGEVRNYGPVCMVAYHQRIF